MSASPARASRAPFERAHDPRRDPSAVEATFVGVHLFVVDEARVDALWVERHVIGDGPEALDRIAVGPNRIDRFLAVDDDRVVVRLALPLAERPVRRRDEMLHRDIVWWEVVRRRLTRLEHAMSAR